jgi:methyl-accepting chemotaxis protein
MNIASIRLPGNQSESTPPKSRPLQQRRFLRRWSVGLKLWTTTVILAVPLIGLGVFYTQSLTSTLWFSATELQGVALYRPLDELTNEISQHSEWVARHLTGDKEAGRAATELANRIDAALTQYDKLNATAGNAALRRQVAELRQRWTQLESNPPADLDSDLRAHAAVLDALESARNQIGTDWLLILDPQLTTYDLLDVSLNKVPDAGRALSETHVHLRALRASVGDAREHVLKATALVALVRDRVSAALDEIKGAEDATRQSRATDKSQPLDTAAYAKVLQWCVAVDAAFMRDKMQATDVDVLLSGAESALQATRASNKEVLVTANAALTKRHDQQRRDAIAAIGGSVLALTLAIAFMLTLSTRIAGAIKRLLSISERIAEGRYDNVIDSSGSDEVSRLFAGMSHMQQRLKSQIDSEREAAAEIKRIKQALDFASSNIMITDENYNVIYVNHALQRLFKESAADFKRDLPRFDGGAILGSGVDTLHRDPVRQRKVMEELESTHTQDVELGGHTLRLSMTPVFDESGHRIGTLLEWLERTAEVSAEQELDAVVKQALNGNLSARIKAEGKAGFYGVMATNLNRLLGNVTSIVRDTQQASHDVCRGSDEISEGNTNLSQRTEEQASSLAETAASMEQMTSTVKRNADNASHANQLATAARNQAMSGSTVAVEAVHAMDRIKDSSNRIGAIINVIDEIAFQTNLLALNAAVEAARAGEQGRGFAVVAGEVRNLAGRSAAAAKEIKALIEDTAQRVHDGSHLVARCGGALEEIVAAVQKVSDTVAEIAAASAEQSSGIAQVNLAVSQMDEVTQQNAALVEQISASSHNMSDLARELAKQLSRYTLDAADVLSTDSSSRDARMPHPPTGSRPNATRSGQAVRKLRIARAKTAVN